MSAYRLAVEAAPPVDLVDAGVRAGEVRERQEDHDGSDEDVPEHGLIMHQL